MVTREGPPTATDDPAGRAGPPTAEVPPPCADEESPSRALRAAAPPGGVTARAVLIGLALIPPNCYWVGTIEGVWHGLHFTCLSLAMNAVFLLLALVAANVGLRRLGPKRALTQGELMTVFCMLALSSVLVGHDRLVTLMGVIAHAGRYATPENQWESLFLGHLPKALLVTDPEAAYHYYSGGSAYWSTGYWRHWVLPALGWTSFWGALVWAMLCLTVLLRQRWTESERLSYPILQVPLAVTEPTGGLFRSRLMWLGFGLAAGLDLVNGLNYLFPWIPGVTYQGPQLEVGQHFVSTPWNAIGSLRLDVFPFMVGIAFLLPQDLIFSTWFFYLMGKGQQVWGAATGVLETTPLYPYHGMQAAGAVAALGLAALWEARRYLRQVWLRVIHRPSEVSDAGEALSYRGALVGLAGGMLWVGLFALWIGMEPLLIPVYFLLFLLIALTLARLRADTGIPAHGLVNVNPQDILITHLGTAGMPRQGVAALGLLQWVNRFNRAHPMPVGLESLKACRDLSLDHRRMLGALVLTTVVSLFCGFAIYPALMYRHGAALAAELNWTGWATYGNLASWIQSPKQPDPVGMGFFAGGGAFALGLAALRTRFVWWPFHPLGYALGAGYTVDRWWLALVLCTVIKGVLIRYTGIRGYRQAIPFFIGLVLGQYVVSCLWSLLALLLNEPMYWTWQG